MSQRIDHEVRKRKIAVRAMHLFSKVGFDNVSLIMIAESCGIARTVLYRYFCDKREVLDASIMAVTGEMSEKCNRIIRGRDPIVRKLELVCHEVVDVMFANKEFLIAVFDYVIGMVRTGVDMNATIAQFTSGTRDAIRLLVEHGIRNGDFPPILIPERTTDAVYAEFESCALRIVLGTERDAAAAKVRFSDVIRAISTWKGGE